MLKLFLKKKKLSSGSVFTKCETGVTLKLLHPKVRNFYYATKNYFEQIKNLLFLFP